MHISEDRISDLAHRVAAALKKDRGFVLESEPRALQGVKNVLERFFCVYDEVEEAVKAKLRTKVPGSREYEILYQKFQREEMDKRKL